MLSARGDSGYEGAACSRKLRNRLLRFFFYYRRIHRALLGLCELCYVRWLRCLHVRMWEAVEELLQRRQRPLVEEVHIQWWLRACVACLPACVSDMHNKPTQPILIQTTDLCKAHCSVHSHGNSQVFLCMKERLMCRCSNNQLPPPVAPLCCNSISVHSKTICKIERGP